MELPRIGYSLAKLAARVLKGRLNKTMQCSDWNVRPLTGEQLHYAALDAEVLLHLYEVLQQREAASGGSLQILPRAVTVTLHKKSSVP